MSTAALIATELTALAFSDTPTEPVEIEVCRDGTWQHPTYGTVTINPAARESMLANFRANVRRVGDLPLDYDHQQGPASGWLTDLRQDGESLRASVQFTPTAREKIQRGEYRFFSPEWHPNFKDPASGKEHGPTLFGGGLTNRPFFRELAALPCNETETGVEAPAQETHMATETKPDESLKPAEGMTAEQFAELQGRLTAVEAENAALKAREERVSLTQQFSDLAFGERKTARLAPASRSALVEALITVPAATRKTIVDAVAAIQFAELGERGFVPAEGSSAKDESLTDSEEMILKATAKSTGQKFDEVKAKYVETRAARQGR